MNSMTTFEWVAVGLYSVTMLALFIIFTIIWRKLK